MSVDLDVQPLAVPRDENAPDFRDPVVVARNLVTNPRGRDTSGTVTVRENLYTGQVRTYSGASYTRETVSDSLSSQVIRVARNVQGGGLFVMLYPTPYESGALLSFSFRLRQIAGPPGQRLTVSVYGYTGGSGAGEATGGDGLVRVDTTETWQEVVGEGYTLPDGADQVGIRLSAYGSDQIAADAVFEIDAVLIEDASMLTGPYFDGDTWDGDPDLTPEWTGTPGESTSRLVAPKPVGWDGAGIWWSAEHDAVYVPAGVEPAPPIDGQDTPVFYTIAADPLGAYVRASTAQGGYFDGDTPNQPPTIYTWTATPHASTSTRTRTQPTPLLYGPQIELPSGLVLGSRDRAGVEWHVEELTGWNEVDSTGTHTQRSYRHGAWIDRAFYPARIMAITGRFVAPRAGTRDEQYALLEAAADRLLGSVPLEDPAEVVVTAGGRTRLVRARQDGPQFARVNPPGTWGEFSLQLVAPDPRRLSAGPEHTASTGLPSTVGGLVVPGRWL